MILDFNNENLEKLNRLKLELMEIMSEYSYQEENGFLLYELDKFREYILNSKEEEYKKLCEMLLKNKSMYKDIERKLNDTQMLLFRREEDDPKLLKQQLKEYQRKIDLYQKEIDLYDKNCFTEDNLEKEE